MRREYKEMQTKSQGILRKAIRSGLIKKIDESTKCVDCGKPAYCYDHRDYLKPLKVEAVCRSCNGKRGGSVNKPDFPNTITPVRRARLERNLSIEEVAKLVLISASGLYYIERGDRSPSPATARLLFEVYGGTVSYPQLFGVPETVAEAKRILKMKK